MTTDFRKIADDAYADPDQREKLEHLDGLGQSLWGKLRDTWVLKQSLETRWYDDLRQYHGQYDEKTEAQLAKVNEEGGARSSLFVNKTRKFTNGAAGRVSDLLFPAREENWDITHTEVPSLSHLSSGPYGDTEADEARAILAEAEDRASNMKSEIKDQLTEANYSSEAREVIKDAAKIGAGVMKAPFTINRVRKKWAPVEGGVYEMLFEKDPRPSARRVDPWDFFPDMTSQDPAGWEFTFERKRVNKLALYRMIEQNGFIKAKVASVCASDPKSSWLDSTYIQHLRDISGIAGITHETQYELWEYTGPIERSDLEAAGCDYDEEAFANDMIPVLGKVFFIGPDILKADLFPLESMDIEYSVFRWEKDESTVFGYGIPYLMRDAQKAMNSAWRMLLDNAGLGVGPQIVIDDKIIEPMDGRWCMTPMKLWRFKGHDNPSKNPRDAFGTHNIDIHEGELMNILAAAADHAEQETGMPQISQGDPSGAPHQVTTMAMMMNASNTVLRSLVKQWDDDITVPVISRFYHWNMQYSRREDIKGDHEAKARGSSALLVKEMQAQSLMMLVSLMANPAVAELMQPKLIRLLRRIVEAHHIDPDDVLPTDDEMEEMEAGQEEQPDAGIALEQAKMAQEIQIWQMRLASQAEDREAKLAEIALTARTAIVKMATEKDVSIEKIYADLEKHASSEETKLIKAEMEEAARQDEKQWAELHGTSGIHATV